MTASRRPVPERPGPGIESVWDYPRPPRVERVDARITVVFAGRLIADTMRGYRVLETSHPPNYYIPRNDIERLALVQRPRRSLCEWKGLASYYDVYARQRVATDAAWSYEDPNDEFGVIANHVAFYAGKMDACFIDDEPVSPQPGGFYGGWITRNIAGPFKGVPDSEGW